MMNPDQDKTRNLSHNDGLRIGNNGFVNADEKASLY